MLEQIEGHTQTLLLHVSVTGSTNRVPEREIGEEESGHTTVLDDVAPGADDDGGQAGRFELTGNQTHGLVADWSEGDQQDDVDVVLAAPLDDGRRVDLDGASLAVLGGYPEDARCQ